MEDAQDWLAYQRKTQHFSVKMIPVGLSRQWAVEKGRLSHSSGRFFAVTGYQWKDPMGERFCSPYILQPEVGTLCFIVFSDSESYFLLDAKFEPGNTKFVDGAPTIQATQSNIERSHGGSGPRLYDFIESSIHGNGVLQSEQGSRFIDKYNLNLSVLASALFPAPRGMMWVPAEQLKRMLLSSHTLNTDARSVIVSSDWSYLGRSGSIFRNAKAIEHGFQSSYEKSVESPEDLARLQDKLRRHASEVCFSAEEVGLHVSTNRITPQSSYAPTGVAVEFVLSTSREREVSRWDQPLLRTNKKSVETLYFTVVDGVCHFLFQAVAEVGYSKSSQFGNSDWTGDPARSKPSEDWKTHQTSPAPVDSELIARVIQSDEGGRFYQQNVVYEIRRLRRPHPIDDENHSFAWLTLSQVNSYSKVQGFFTNEARSAISLLLGFA